MKRKSILVGCDPEGFVVDSNGVAVSAAPLLPGSKKEPHKVPYGAVQVDGMAAEFNIAPAATAKTFVKRILSVQETMKGMLPKGHDISYIPSIDFPDEVWANALPAEIELGCEPDFNAYTGEQNQKPNGNVKFRTASGHIHIGWTEGIDITDPQHLEACHMLCKELDLALALPSLFIDKDTRRRELYGSAGSYRPKPYGVEYRVLSNFWLTNPDLMSWVFNQVVRSFNTLVKRGALRHGKSVNLMEVLYAINTGNLSTAARWYQYILRNSASRFVKPPEIILDALEEELKKARGSKAKILNPGWGSMYHYNNLDELRQAVAGRNDVQ